MARYSLRPLSPWATRLRTRARLLGLSDTEVARRAGLSQSRYANYLAGLREPPLDVLDTVCRVLGLTLDAVLQGTPGDQTTMAGADPAQDTTAPPGSASADPVGMTAPAPAQGFPVVPDEPMPLSGLRRSLLAQVVALPEEMLPLAAKLLKALEPDDGVRARAVTSLTADAAAAPPAGDFSDPKRRPRPPRQRLPRHP